MDLDNDIFEDDLHVIEMIVVDISLQINIRIDCYNNFDELSFLKDFG